MCNKAMIFNQIIDINKYLLNISKKENIITFQAILTKSINKKAQILFQIISTKLKDNNQDNILERFKKN